MKSSPGVFFVGYRRTYVKRKLSNISSNLAVDLRIKENMPIISTLL